MRVAQVREFGGPEVLVPAELPDPVAGPDEVVVAVDHIDTLFVQTQIRAGEFGEYFDVRPPYVPGGGISGTVASTGSEVDPAVWTGRRVIAAVEPGSYASLAAVPVDHLVPVPENLGLREAAALVHDSVTALALLELTALKAGETVLITGASGGMGTLLVQLARSLGARVVAVARGDEKTALVRELGAHEVVDAASPDWPERAAAVLGGAGADVVLDGVGGAVGAAAFPLTAPGGRFSAHGAPTGHGFAAVSPEEAAARAITLLGIADVQLTPERRTTLAARALEEAAAGRLRTVIGAVFPLERAGDACTSPTRRGDGCSGTSWTRRAGPRGASAGRCSRPRGPSRTERWPRTRPCRSSTSPTGTRRRPSVASPWARTAGPTTAARRRCGYAARPRSTRAWPSTRRAPICTSAIPAGAP
ncbi:zinc-binding dehydrogenase [Streptomyces sp. ERV7]|uniref:zinc-binding dehydrogenase n=1 Tax=Streptomyces sp. ERV7 TaxID=1322334 RepID=UPI00099FC345|nr:zinc-binding dehydrogenase [Streptomyces sp. ERV7]